MVQLAPKPHICPYRVRFSATSSEAPPRASELASAWTRLPGGVVDGGEIVLLAIKPSLWRPLFESAPWAMMCGLLAAALVWLGRPLPGLSLAATAQLMLLFAFARLGLAVVRWIPAWYVLTNRRVIDIRGVRVPRIAACPLLEVRNTYVHATTVEQWARLGTITFVTDHSKQPAQVWQSVAKPEQVHQRIRRAIENAIDQHSPGS